MRSRIRSTGLFLLAALWAPAVSAGQTPPRVSLIDDAAVVLEYGSVYDVHTGPEPGSTLPPRSQLGAFSTDRILEDLEGIVDPTAYDFVLVYSLTEVPGWIHFEGRNVETPARNIGLDNCCYGAGPLRPKWPRLRAAPHMNAVSFIEATGPADVPDLRRGLLRAAHEMGHFWSVRWSHAPVGPREWKPDMPVGWLAEAGSHWTWNWVDEGEEAGPPPGIMSSDPSNSRFNEFDLYAMGLMGYDEVRSVRHPVYECDPPENPVCRGPIHAIGIDDLIAGLAASAPPGVDGDGRRFPDVDASMTRLRILPVIVKGADEILTAEQASLIRRFAANMPAAWSEATWGRSTMTVGVVAPAVPPSCGESARARCVVPLGRRPAGPVELGPRP